VFSGRDGSILSGEDKTWPCTDGDSCGEISCGLDSKFVAAAAFHGKLGGSPQLQDLVSILSRVRRDVKPPILEFLDGLDADRGERHSRGR
jgi:hypothetical protein